MVDCTVFQCERRRKGARISIRGLYLILISKKKNKVAGEVVRQEIPAAEFAGIISRELDRNGNGNVLQTFNINGVPMFLQYRKKFRASFYSFQSKPCKGYHHYVTPKGPCYSSKKPPSLSSPSPAPLFCTACDAPNASFLANAIDLFFVRPASLAPR